MFSVVPPLSRAVHAVALACAVGLSACVLFVPERDVADHCPLAGATTECGVCLASRCQAEIDESCNDESLLQPVETCAASRSSICSTLPASSLTTCLIAKCAARCGERTGVSETRCEEEASGPGLACSCTSASSTNDEECGSRTYPGTRCCAPAAWPGPGLACTCKAPSCFSSSDGCVCVLSDAVSLDTARECTGTHCCAVSDRCQCRERACVGAEREVAACNLAALSCVAGTSEVSECSVRR